MKRNHAGLFLTLTLIMLLAGGVLWMNLMKGPTKKPSEKVLFSSPDWAKKRATTSNNDLLRKANKYSARHRPSKKAARDSLPLPSKTVSDKSSTTQQLSQIADEYLAVSKQFSRKILEKPIFEKIYQSPQKHQALVDSLTHFDQLLRNFGEKQAQFRLLAISYVNYLYQSKSKTNEMIAMINAIAEEIQEQGERKRRFLDLEDLLVGYFSQISYEEFLSDPHLFLSDFIVTKDSLRHYRHALLAAYDQFDRDIETYRHIASLLKDMI